MSPEPNAGTGISARREALERAAAIARLPWFWPALAGLTAFALVAGVLAWATHGGRPTLKFELAFSPNACCSWQVWVNGTSARDITVFPIQAGRSAVYSVPLETTHVAHLRMPLGERPGSAVVVRRIWVSRGSQTIDTAAPRDYTRSITYDASHTAARGGGIRVEAVARHPFLDLPVSLETKESSVRIFLSRVEGDALRFVVGVLLLGTLVTVPFALRSRRQTAFLVALALALLAARGLPRLLWHMNLQDDVSRSVGQSVYLGQPKAREQWLLQLTALLAIVLPATVAFVARRRRPEPTRDEADLAAARPLPRWAPPALVAVPVVLLALWSAPDLKSLIGAGRTVQYVPAWDSNNLIFWQYLIQKAHLRPMGDFFWPYGLQWLFDLGVPWGQTLSYVVYLAFWALLVLGTYVALARFFRGRGFLLRFGLVTGFVLTAALAGFVAPVTRYVVPLATVLLFAGIDERDGLRSWRRILFSIVLLGAALFEVAQAVYALVPVVFLLAVDLATRVPRHRREIVRWLAVTAATVGVPLGLAVAILGATGELGGTAGYYGQLGALTTSYAEPAPTHDWVAHPAGLAGFVWWAVPLALALGAYGFIVRRDRLRYAQAVVVALGLLGLMVMQKQVLRPPIEGQIWLPPVYALVFWAITDTSLARLRRWSAVAAVAGAAAAIVLVSGGARSGWDSVSSGPGRLSRSVGALLHERAAFAADRRAQWSRSRFDLFANEKPVVAALEHDPSVRAGGRVWILGDDAPITMMLGRSWPYYFDDFYDTSPIAFQRRVLRTLERKPPARVVFPFAPEAMIFDNVPNVVRVPLLFQWAVTHLAPARRSGSYAILRPLRRGEPVHLAWWRMRIGSSVSLAHLPEVAGAGGDACSSGPDCGTYVVLEFPAGRKPPSVTVPVIVGGLRFDVQVATSGARRYVIPLDRLWFWTPGSDTRHAVRATTLGGARVSVLRRRLDPGRLY